MSQALLAACRSSSLRDERVDDVVPGELRGEQSEDADDHERPSRCRGRRGGDRRRARRPARTRRASAAEGTRRASSGARTRSVQCRARPRAGSTMRPASAGILSATWLPMPIRSAASSMIARRSSVTSPFDVETRLPPPSRTCTSVLCVCSSVTLKSCWNAGLLERAVDDLVRGLAQPGGRWARRGPGSRRAAASRPRPGRRRSRRARRRRGSRRRCGSPGRRGASCDVSVKTPVFSATRLIQIANDERSSRRPATTSRIQTPAERPATLPASRLREPSVLASLCDAHPTRPEPTRSPSANASCRARTARSTSDPRDEARDLDRRGRDEPEVDRLRRRACGTSAPRRPGASASLLRRATPCRGRRSPSTSSGPIASCARASARRVAGTSSCGTENESAAEAVRDVLEDRVDVDVLGRDRVEDRGGEPGSVGHAGEVEDDLVLGVRHGRDDRLLERCAVLDPRPGLGRERRAGVDRARPGRAPARPRGA